MSNSKKKNGIRCERTSWKMKRVSRSNLCLSNATKNQREEALRKDNTTGWF